MVDLYGKPYYLNETEAAWVKNTLASLTTEEKCGQLLCVMGGHLSDERKKQLFTDMGVGAVLYRPCPSEHLKSEFEQLDSMVKIPLLKAANLEEGGSGGISDGTVFGSQMQVAATDEPEMADKFGLVCGVEGRANGINWTYSPVTDLDINFLNPITNTRTYGSVKERVSEFASHYVKAVQSCGVAAAAKHYPGDGVDFRDQHLHPSWNTLSAQDWYDSYGAVYKRLIDEGMMSIMVGHIIQPNVARDINPALKDEDLLPGSLSKEMLQGVLREKYAFNGVITTDATIMGGFTMAMPRRRALPYAIECGCDMLVFNINVDEDYKYLLEGVRDGILSPERLDEAVERLLAMKAVLVRPVQLPEIDAAAWAKECAQRAVLLVKDKENMLPLDVKKYPKLRLIVQGNDRMFDGAPLTETAKVRLEAEGFQVEVFNERKLTFDFPPMESIPTDRLTLYMVNEHQASNKTVLRLSWCEKHAMDKPWTLNEEPHVFVSLASPYHLADVPLVRTYINCYTATVDTVNAAIDKLVGKSEFTGVSPVDPFCGLPDTRL